MTELSNISRISHEPNDLVQGPRQSTQHAAERSEAEPGTLGVIAADCRLGEEARRRARWLAASTEVISGLLNGASAAETTQLVVEKATQIVDADAAFLLLRDEDGDVDALAVRAAHGEGAEAFIGQQYTLNKTLAGQVFTGRLNGPGIVIPLASADRVLGVLSVARFHGSKPFLDADVQMMHAFAGHVALVVEFSRVAGDRQLLAIYEDRDRIARDLQNVIIQRLFAIGLRLHGVLPKVTQPEVVHQLSAFVDELDATIQDVRRTIFSLRGPEV